MTERIRKVGVLGAGVMGSGIAAHLANASIDVVLLDILPPGLSDADATNRAKRNTFAQRGLDGALKAKPAAFFHPSRARHITVGNFDDDFELLADCDLVIEAIIEKLEIKRELFSRLEGALKQGTIVASNTSGLPIAEMVEGRSDAFRRNFLVMHFFNPVRYMKLLELVAGEETDPAVFERVQRFGEDLLGKGIVRGKDTPNFVGNRIGVYGMLLTMHEMLESGLSIEDIDQITGPAMGRPRSASFRTADIVGIDTLVHVADHCYEALVDDEEREVFKVPDVVRQMVEKKLLGGKTKAGFYKKIGKDISTYDFASGDYRPKGGDEAIRKLCKDIGKLSDPAERIRKLVADEGPAGQFAWKTLSRALAYAGRRIGEITDSIEDADNAMKWGFNWDLGPFEVWDALGFRQTAERMKAEGIDLGPAVEAMLASGAERFYTAEQELFDLGAGTHRKRAIDPRTVTLAGARKGAAPVLSNAGAEAWDLGGGVLGFTFKSKANSIDDDVVTLLNDAIDRAERDFAGLLLFNEGQHFCVGANIFGIVMVASQKQWDRLHTMVSGLQQCVWRMRYSQVPVVAAPYSMTLAGGLELCLGCDAVQAAAETYTGLVEAGIGVIPAGGGTTNLVFRALEGLPEGTEVDPFPMVAQVFKNIGMASVATSAVEAQEKGYFRKSDGVSFDAARLLHEAKGRVIGMAQAGYHPPTPRAYRLPGESGIATLSSSVDTLVTGGYATEHDGVVAKKLAHIVCGGVGGASRLVTEQEMLDLEREAFVSLCGEPKTVERMQYMLMNNKPLRN